jgi:hypothetical protein
MRHPNPSVQTRYRHQLEGRLAEDAQRLDEDLTGAAAGTVVSLSTGAQKAATASVEGKRPYTVSLENRGLQVESCRPCSLGAKRCAKIAPDP